MAALMTSHDVKADMPYCRVSEGLSTQGQEVSVAISPIKRK